MSAKPLNEISNMPQMGAAFAGWMSEITLQILTETIVEGFVQVAFTPVSFQGVIQPLKANMIALKPEGQRSWEWLQIHAFAGSLNLKNGDKIVYNSVRYKVMAQNDYSLNNYIEYHVTQDFTGPENG